MAYKFNPISGAFDLVGGGPSDGEVTGPASAIDGAIVLFDGITGKVIKDSEITLADLSNYSEVFNNTTDWTLDVDSYFITVTKAIHKKDNPIVQTLELSGLDYVEVTTGVRVDASENVIITVNSTPDLRFEGKLIIS